MKERLITQIEKYTPFNRQEELDKKTILYFLRNFNDIFYRENLIAHMTASCWLVNQNCDKVVMAYHNLYDSYSWLGGHCDGDENPLNVAIKEAKEESGLTNIKALSNDIFSLEVLAVDHHIKNNSFVPAHLHLICEKQVLPLFCFLYSVIFQMLLLVFLLMVNNMTYFFLSLLHHSWYVILS